MLNKVLMWGAILDGAVKGLKPLPAVAPEAIAILWCPSCQAWIPYNGEEERNYPICSGGRSATHHKPALMRLGAYSRIGKV